MFFFNEFALDFCMNLEDIQHSLMQVMTCYHRYHCYYTIITARDGLMVVFSSSLCLQHNNCTVTFYSIFKDKNNSVACFL